MQQGVYPFPPLHGAGADIKGHEPIALFDIRI